MRCLEAIEQYIGVGRCLLLGSLLAGPPVAAALPAPLPTPLPTAATAQPSPRSAHLCAYVPLPGAQTVAVVDLTTNQATGAIPVSDPLHVTVSPDGSRAYVTGALSHQGTGAVAVIDTTTNVVIDTIPLGGTPFAVAVAPAGSPVYATYAQSDCCRLAIIDAQSDTVTGRVPGAGNGALGIAITPDGATAYIAEGTSQLLAVINLTNSTVTTELPVVMGPADQSNGPVAVAMTPDGAFAYVVVQSIFADQPSPVLVIDTKTNTVATTLLAGNAPVAVSITPDGRFAYVANSQSGSISVIDTASNTVSSSIVVGGVPSATAFSPDGARAYVANFTTKAVDVIDTTARTAIESISVSDEPNDIAIAAEPDGCQVPPTMTPTVTVTPSATSTPTSTLSPTASPSRTVTPSASATATLTATATRTSTPTITFTASATVPPPDSPTATRAVTATSRPQNTPMATSSTTPAAADNGGGGCSMTPTHRDSTSAVTLVPLVAFLLRRRRKGRVRGGQRTGWRVRGSHLVPQQFPVILTVALLSFSTPRHARSQVVTEPGAAAHGSEVYLDANGQPTVPGPDVLGARHAPAPVTQSAAPATPAVQPAPGGGEMMVLDKRFRNNSGQAAAPVPAPSGH